MTTLTRVSEISQWVECEVKALHSPRRPGRQHVAAWVGTLAHAMLANQHLPAPPPRLQYDSTTTTSHMAEVQAKNIASEARYILGKANLGVLDEEMAVKAGDVDGHLDLLVWDRAGRRKGVLDLKTGQIGAGWIQVGGYLTGVPEATFGGILHVPRAKQQTGRSKASLELRDAFALRLLWARQMDRIDSIVNEGETPLPSPGLACARCQVPDCVARV